MTAAASRSRQPELLASGAFEGEIGSFRLQLAAEGKSPRTIRMYTEAVRWFAAAHLLRETALTCWEQVCGQDVQRWMFWLLSRYSNSYASNQYRVLQQFFRWQSEPDPLARLRAPIVRDKLIPVFTSGELPDPEKACQGRTFAQRRDYAIMAVFRARPSEPSRPISATVTLLASLTCDVRML